MRPKRKQPQKRIIIIAGPNGAGKTTFAEQFLSREREFSNFINADLIARGLSPFAPESVAIQAGRIMLEEIAFKVQRAENFAFETTLSGKSYARHITEWRAAGYSVTLYFLSLPSADAAFARVRARVAQGGHAIAEEVVRRRFDAGLRNFHAIYCNLVDIWVLYDNSGPSPVMIDAGGNQ